MRSSYRKFEVLFPMEGGFIYRNGSPMPRLCSCTSEGPVIRSSQLCASWRVDGFVGMVLSLITIQSEGDYGEVRLCLEPAAPGTEVIAGGAVQHFDVDAFIGKQYQRKNRKGDGCQYEIKR
ncbi:hypothetical protein Gotur_030135 [Gossypium turneri]